MPENIHINLPDGSSNEVPSGATALDVAKSISQRLGKILPADRVRQGGFCGEKMKLRLV